MPDFNPITKRGEAKLDHDTVHADVARYLTNPITSQATNEEYVPDSICDSEVLRQLLLFRGFITKVKHNGLRRIIPCTLRLLAHMGLEIDFFVAVSPAYVELRQAGPIPSDRHLEWVERKINEWLNRTQPDSKVLISDVLTHEMTVVNLRQAGNGSVATRLPYIPRFVGEVRLGRYETDVLVATNKLSAGTFDPEKDWIERNVSLVYHQVSGRSVSILEVDPFLVLVFSLVDGKRSVDEIANALALKGLPEATQPVLHSVFCEVAEQGLLEYAP